MGGRSRGGNVDTSRFPPNAPEPNRRIGPSPEACSDAGAGWYGVSEDVGGAKDTESLYCSG